MSTRRNIVLITLDSVRADHCGFLGYHRETTPTLGKMARKGLCFKNAIASGVATPTSMFGVHTGTYPNASYVVGKLNGYEWRKEFQSRKTLAQVLGNLDYFTGAIHANPAVSRFFGFNKGFKYFQDFLDENRRNITNSFLDVVCSMCNKLKIKDFVKNTITVLRREGTAMDWNKLLSYIIEFTEISRKKGHPYFLWVLLLDTHIPYIPPKDNRRWCNVSTPRIIYLNWKVRKYYLCADCISYFDKSEIINAYDDTIYYADKFIKTLWELLRDDDPIFIIHADHGEGFGEHGFFYHPAMLYEELVHVPLVVYNVDTIGSFNVPVSLLGIAPTILELIDCQVDFPSKSFLYEDCKWVISKVFDGHHWKIAVRTKDWKYILGQKKDGELFYLKKDPIEQENLINECNDVVRDMRKIIEQHLMFEKSKVKVYDAIKKLKGRYSL